MQNGARVWVMVRDKMANIEFRVQHSQRYLFNAIPDTNFITV